MGGDGERPALIGTQATISHGELGPLVAETAAGLRRLGVGPGRVVALALGSTPDLVVALLGVWAAGGRAVPLNAHWWPRETTAVLDAVAPDVVLRAPTVALGDHVPALVAGGAGRAATEQPGAVIDVSPGDGPDSLLAPIREAGAAGADAGRARSLADLVAEGAELWAASTGCTGEPRTYAFDDAQLRDQWLAPLPEAPGSVACWTDAAHPPTLRLLLGALAGGASVHLTERWAPRRALGTLGERPVDLLWATAPQLARAVRSPLAGTGGRLARRVVAIGGPLHPPVAALVRQRFGAEVTVRYTCTEAGGWVTTGAAVPGPGAEAEAGPAEVEPDGHAHAHDGTNRRAADDDTGAGASAGPAGRSADATDRPVDEIAVTERTRPAARGVPTGLPAAGVEVAVEAVDGLPGPGRVAGQPRPGGDGGLLGPGRVAGQPRPGSDSGEERRGAALGELPVAAGELHVGGPASARGVGARDGRPRPDRGWPTGDLVELGPAGEVHLLGRLVDGFVSDGRPVVPLEVEVALGRDPRLAEVVVVPRPDPVRGAIGVAVTVPTDLEAPPFLHELAGRLAALPVESWPTAQCVIGELPLSAGGHVHRRLLAFEEASR